ncbi:MAG: ADP-dependent glucokinase/phosphofructokinase [Chloroflexi bacterium]|nr:ADP-dependent glucokinase/phosphofructokinase [Chloroflexota bacterium]
MIEQAWRQRFRTLPERAKLRAEAARQGEVRIACGFTANLDQVVAFDQSLADRLFAGQRIDVAAPRVNRADSIADLLTGVAQCVTSGTGHDLPVRDAAVQDWLLERVTGRVQIGGTGAQAAATLARLGFPVLIHLTGRSPAQIAALPAREVMTVGSRDGVVPIEAASDPADPTMWHVVLEFPEGVQAPLPGVSPAPAANRVIVSYDPVNSAFTIDPGFDAALGDPDHEIGALLVSGFSQVTEHEVLEQVLRDTAEAIRIWRAARPRMPVHLELGAMPESGSVMRVLETLHPVVTSIGLNIDELRDLLHGLDVTMAKPSPELIAQFRWLAARYPAPRWSLHTREFCLSLVDGDAAKERDALLFGSLVAATRSRIGDFPRVSDLQTTLERAVVNPTGMTLLHSLGIADDGCGDDGLVVTPGLRIEGAQASVGLGDSFTAGVLAML